MNDRLFLIEYYAGDYYHIRYVWIKANTALQACMIVGLWDNQANDIISCSEETEYRN